MGVAVWWVWAGVIENGSDNESSHRIGMFT